MRKNLIVGLFLILLVCVYGCGKKDSNDLSKMEGEQSSTTELNIDENNNNINSSDTEEETISIERTERVNSCFDDVLNDIPFFESGEVLYMSIDELISEYGEPKYYNEDLIEWHVEEDGNEYEYKIEIESPFNLVHLPYRYYTEYQEHIKETVDYSPIAEYFDGTFDPWFIDDKYDEFKSEFGTYEKICERLGGKGYYINIDNRNDGYISIAWFLNNSGILNEDNKYKLEIDFDPFTGEIKEFEGRRRYLRIALSYYMLGDRVM